MQYANRIIQVRGVRNILSQRVIKDTISMKTRGTRLYRESPARTGGVHAGHLLSVLQVDAGKYKYNKML